MRGVGRCSQQKCVLVEIRSPGHRGWRWRWRVSGEDGDELGVFWAQSHQQIEDPHAEQCGHPTVFPTPHSTAA